MSNAETPEEVVRLADLVAERGYKNTGQMILVLKDDARRLVFEHC